MIQPVGISFKSTYVDNSYRFMNEEQRLTVGNIISALQRHAGESTETTESLYEKKGIDFYITNGGIDGVDVYYAESFGGEIGSAKKVLIGSYNREKPFDTKYVDNRYKWRSTLNTVKMIALAVILGIFTFGMIKSCKNERAVNRLPQNIIAKK